MWHLFLYVFVVSLPLILNLVIPAKCYERRAGRACCFAASAFTIGLSIALAGLVGILANLGGSEINSIEGMGPLVLAFLAMPAVGFSVAGAVVSLKRLRPEGMQIVATTIAGVGVGALLVWLMYMLHFFE